MLVCIVPDVLLDWYSRTFDDTSWPAAYECGPGEYWSFLDSRDLIDLPEEAIPIWNGPQDVAESIYCRWTLGLNLYTSYIPQ